ncbi:hypothetical protein NDU88_011027 [Pleurodeles waltl]|uniref:Uncharacterized protein n=1 Tax=Pleurodeles waltl TaxID=8319 RepID=A0AAV7QZV2_PLEWA|nr:hypothetical protein NDU88_011027 [Pleurodeles waltl]
MVPVVSVAVGSILIAVTSKGVGNLVGKVDGNGAGLKDRSNDIVTAGGSDDGKGADGGVESSTVEQGCVVGLHAEGTSVWIVGHPFIHWAAKQADSRTFVRQLGFDGSQVKVSWIRESGMR